MVVNKASSRIAYVSTGSVPAVDAPSLPNVVPTIVTVDSEDEFDEDISAGPENDRSPLLTGARAEWVKKQLELVKLSMKNNSNPYTSRTAVLVNGWIYPPNPSFRASTSAIRYTFPRIFVWLPRYLTEVIKCPRCSSHNTKSDGWPTHPIARRVVDLHDCYYLATRRQKCNACNLSFMGNGLSILKSLPPHSLSLYPAFLTHRSGMDFQVINLLRHSVSESFGFESFKRLLKANHMRRHDELELQYYSAFKNDKTPKGKETKHILPDPFPSFFESDFGGFVPSANYLSHVFMSFQAMHEPSLVTQIVKASGDIIGLDHSFKVDICHRVSPSLRFRN